MLSTANTNPRSVGHLPYRADVQDDHHRVRRRLEPDHLRVLADTRLDGREIGRIDRAKVHTELREDLVEDAEGSTIDIVADQDVVALLQRRDCGRYRCESRGERQPVFPLLQAPTGSLEPLPCGVPAPGRSYPRGRPTPS